MPPRSEVSGGPCGVLISSGVTIIPLPFRPPSRAGSGRAWEGAPGASGRISVPRALWAAQHGPKRGRAGRRGFLPQARAEANLGAVGATDGPEMWLGHRLGRRRDSGGDVRLNQPECPLPHSAQVVCHRPIG